MWSRTLTFLRDEGNRALLGWVGSGFVVLIAGLWAAFVYFFPPKKDDGGGAINVEANCSAAAQGTFIGSFDHCRRRYIHGKLPAEIKITGVAAL